jgi:hypothetical protein
VSARTWQLHPLAPLIATKSHERQVDRCSAHSLICYSLSSCNFKQVVCLYGTGSSQVERVEQGSPVLAQGIRRFCTRLQIYLEHICLCWTVTVPVFRRGCRQRVQPGGATTIYWCHTLHVYVCWEACARTGQGCLICLKGFLHRHNPSPHRSIIRRVEYGSSAPAHFTVLYCCSTLCRGCMQVA